MATKKKASKKAATKKKALAKKKPLVKKVARKKKRLAAAPAAPDSSLQVSVEFRLGGGEVRAKLFRKTKLIGNQTLDTTGTITFDDAVSGDELSITGACAGKATISTNRDTTPPSTPAAPLKFNQENIFSILGIN